ncbi:LexA family protein [Atopomonas sediminilitoris]|uniref:LexA family protein n=1 Tax=Atopomonas sediminilitoris TaxID=2919919 RepID=UPI001F4D95CB|nr:translesion error-prone DNA polymerase V autoproteolytic subunit [Atopomonas sediminilitoris]MCJ8170772.1 translesion error-prone DNA polymerase V autoproteolytic subunit [Atopomonas sediminilitoris]
MSNITLVRSLEPSGALLPYFTALVPAGFPSPALDHMEHKLSLDELLDLHAPHIYVVRVAGDSMTGVGIFDGDYLIVSRGLTAKPGDIVVACVNGEVFVKRLCSEQGQWLLRSENPRFAPRYILEGDELLIWGVVTNSLRNHRQHA